MIFGCDSKASLDPSEFGDYFRATWYTAPGHDIPSGKLTLLKAKSHPLLQTLSTAKGMA